MRLVHHLISDCFPNFDSWTANRLLPYDCCWNHYRNHWFGILYGRFATRIDALGRDPRLHLAEKKNPRHSMFTHKFGLWIRIGSLRDFC